MHSQTEGLKAMPASTVPSNKTKNSERKIHAEVFSMNNPDPANLYFAPSSFSIFSQVE